MRNLKVLLVALVLIATTQAQAHSAYTPTTVEDGPAESQGAGSR